MKDELNLTSFSDESSNPDLGFQKSLKKKMMKKIHKNNIFINFFYMKNFKYFFIPFLIIMVFFTGIGGFWGYKRWYNSRNYTQILSNSEKQEILSKLFINNYGSQVFAQGLSSQFVNQDEKYQVLENFFDQNNDDYNYRYTKMTPVYNENFEDCDLYKMYGSFQASESFMYQDKVDGKVQSFFKNAVFDEEGNIVIIDIIQNEKSYYYMGGKYAVEIIFPEYDEYMEDYSNAQEPIEVEEARNESYESMYSQYSVEKVVENGSVNYYIITEKSFSFCNFMEAYNENGLSGYESSIKHYIDGQTGLLTKDEYYEGESDLIMTINFEYEEKNIDYSEAQDIFKFDEDIEIREISFPSSQDPLDQLRKTFEESEKLVLVPVNLEDSLEYYSSNYLESGLDYIFDRDYYPEGEVGDEMYKFFTETNELSVTNMGYFLAQSYTNYDSTEEEGIPVFPIESYEYEVDEIKFIEQRFEYANPDGIEIDKSFAEIEGEQIPITIYSFDYDFQVPDDVQMITIDDSENGQWTNE